MALLLLYFILLPLDSNCFLNYTRVNPLEEGTGNPHNAVSEPYENVSGSDGEVYGTDESFVPDEMDSVTDEEAFDPDEEDLNPDEEVIDPDDEVINPDDEVVDPHDEIINPNEEADAGLPNNKKAIDEGDMRIVGGREAEIENFPYQVYILKRLYIHISKCGGSIITDRHILTAAHCVCHRLRLRNIVAAPRSITIELGTKILNQGEKMRTQHIFVHPCYLQWHEYTLAHDIGVVKTLGVIHFRTSVRFIKMSEPGMGHMLHEMQAKENFKCVVAGWGRLSHDGDTPRELMYEWMTLLPTEKCREMTRSFNFRISDDIHICTYDVNLHEQKGVCKGDSGGGLVCNITGIPKVWGVVSFGRRCAGKDSPSFYSRVDTQYDFILSAINGGRQLMGLHFWSYWPILAIKALFD